MDYATTLNNFGSCLFSIGKKSDARVNFELSWRIVCNSLGHRSPRALTIWKNLDKTRRFHATHGTDVLKKIRPDAPMLLRNGNFTIMALPPVNKPKRIIKEKKKKLI